MIERLLGELKVANKNNSETILKDIFIAICNQIDRANNQTDSTLKLRKIRDLIDEHWHAGVCLSETKRRIFCVIK